MKKLDENSLIRKIPANIQAEQMLLGAILTNNDILHKVSDLLNSDHFHEPVHKRIYDAILLIIDKGLSASPISLKNIFDKDQALIGVGGAEYLNKLVIMATSVINASDYAKIIYNLSLRRELINIGEDVVNNAFDQELEISAAEQLELAEAKLYNLSSKGQTDKGFSSLSIAINDSIAKIDKAMRNPGNLTGITTGYIKLDNKLAGFQNSDLIIIAGRPSMGKTAVAINFAINAAQYLYDKNKKENAAIPPSVGFFSLEMPAEQISRRLLATKAEIESSLLVSGRLNDNDYNKIRIQADNLSKMPLFIDDTPALSIAAIRARARRLKRKHNLAILFIDYLQLLRGTDSNINRVLEITEITQGLKAIAKELNIPVIALSQLSRAVEQREDKKPLLSDLRESGSIEQDADIVMFLYREEYYLSRQIPSETGTEKYEKWSQSMSKMHNILDIIIAKHRNGPIGEVQLYYDVPLSKISNLVDNHFSNNKQ